MLWPREHGAYAQLLVPLATALALRVPAAPALCLAVAAISAFLANEPLLVVLGHRGKRARDAAGARAMRALVVFAGVAAIAGTAGLALSGSSTRLVAAGLALPAILLVILAWRRAERTFAGELVAALALPGAGAVVATASGASTRAALTMSLAWSVGFACTVVAVHRVIARHKRRATWLDVAAAVVLLGAAAAGWRFERAIVPLVLLSFALVVRAPSATRLRAIGVVLATTSAVCGCLMLLAMS